MLACMAGQAGLVHVLSGSLGGIEDLARVAPTVDVLFARTMAAFAGRAGFAVLKSKLAVRIVGELLGGLFVTGCAGLGAHKVAGHGLRGMSGGWFGSLFGGGHCRDAENACAKQQQKTDS